MVYKNHKIQNKITGKNVHLRYNLSNKDFERLYDEIIKFLESKNIQVKIVDLENAIEHKEELSEEIEAHHETAISNGKEVFLHNDLDEVSGMKGRIYDLLHVSLGHLFQWSANINSSLKYYGNNAWEIATKNYVGKSERDLAIAREYEAEAGSVMLENLRIVLENSCFMKEEKDSFIRFYNDYMNTDLDYLMDYYRTGEVKNFFSSWKLNSEMLPRINIDFDLEIRERNHECIPLIKA